MSIYGDLQVTIYTTEDQEVLDGQSLLFGNVPQPQFAKGYKFVVLPLISHPQLPVLHYCGFYVVARKVLLKFHWRYAIAPHKERTIRITAEVAVVRACPVGEAVHLSN